MSLQQLSAHVESEGFSYALVHLDKSHSLITKGSLESEGARLIRQAPAYEPGLVETLGRHFAQGWQELSQQLDVESLDSALLTLIFPRKRQPNAERDFP